MNQFMLVAVKGAIILGILGVIGGVILICVTKNVIAGASCIALGSNAVTGLFGILVGQAIPTAADPGSQLSPKVAAFAKALDGAVGTLKSP
jgi:hypothetical protein